MTKKFTFLKKAFTHLHDFEKSKYKRGVIKDFPDPNGEKKIEDKLNVAQKNGRMQGFEDGMKAGLESGVIIIESIIENFLSQDFKE